MKMTPVLIASVAPDDLQIGGDDERRSHEHQPLHVLRHQPEVGRAVPKQLGREQRLLAGPLTTPDPGEEAHDGQRADRDEERGQGEVVVGRQDPADEDHQAGGRQDGPDGVEGASGVGGQRILDAPPQDHDDADDDGLKDEREPPGDGGGDEPPDEWAGGGSDSTHPADDAERLGSGPQVVEQHRREDVDGWDQEGGAHTLENRVTEDQDPQPGRDGTEHRTHRVNGETQREAPLPPPSVRQLAAGDHEGRHHQQEQRDRDLHALDRGVQVLADVIDHDVHVRTGEATDELRQSEGQQHAAQCGGHPLRRRCVSHGSPAHRRSGRTLASPPR